MRARITSPAPPRYSCCAAVFTRVVMVPPSVPVIVFVSSAVGEVDGVIVVEQRLPKYGGTVGGGDMVMYIWANAALDINPKAATAGSKCLVISRAFLHGGQMKNHPDL